MLWGRRREREQLERLVDGALTGDSGALVLVGEPGVGKTALLDHVAAHAESRDVTVLRAGGAPTDATLPFALLGELLPPLLGHLAALPDRQAEALAGALAIGPPVAPDRFAVCAATFGLLAAAAENGPVVVLVDDVQWADDSSADALRFTVRRLRSEGIALVLASRPGGPGDGGVDGRMHGRRVAELVVEGLDAVAAAALVEHHHPGSLAAPVVDELIAATGGNPLALVEVPLLLTAGQRAGREPLPRPLPVAEAIKRAFSQRVDSLPAATREALVVAAADDSGSVSTVTKALVELDLPLDALDAAEVAGLVHLDGGCLELDHPLVRSAIYHAADPPTRRRAHLALAIANDADDQPDRSAWHRASAVVGPDESTARALERAAGHATERGARDAAASALARAAALSESAAERDRRLVAAAEASFAAGRPERARTLLAPVLTRGTGPVRTTAARLKARIEAWGGMPSVAADLLEVEAAAVAPTDPVAAADMMAEAAVARVHAGKVAVAHRLAQRAADLVADVPAERAGIAPTVARFVALMAGEGDLVDPLGPAADQLEDDPAGEGLRLVVFPLIWLEQHERARRLATATVTEARDAGAIALLPFGLVALGQLDTRTGRWAAARARLEEATRLAEEVGQPNSHAFALTSRARLEAVQGRADDCRAHVALARERAATAGLGAVFDEAAAALGLLELGLGNLPAAIDQLERVAASTITQGLAEPAVVPWAPDLIEALARTGDVARAREVLDELAAIAGRLGGRAWPLGVVARGEALLADDDEAAEAHFATSLDHLRALGDPFEVARTLLCLGEHRRRRGRRQDARQPLRQAFAAFDKLGAAPWADRARAELQATGERARRQPRLSDDLTPQELQVALAVAGGQTNREAAAALFLSVKTIETHLTSVYRKLGLRSRTELARLFAERPTEAG